MRICVIGSGVSGLTAALELASHPGVRITVLERAAHFGGRADLDADGEHCPRLFMDDYSRLFSVLRRIDRGDGRTVFDSLRPVRRYAHTPRGGWIEISHLYLAMAGEVPLAEKISVLRAWRSRPLVADLGSNENSYGSLRNYSPPSLLRMAANLLRSKRAYALPGPTDHYLIDPWVAHLRARGVVVQDRSKVTALRPGPDSVAVQVGEVTQHYDAVLVTAFLPDLAELLEASGIRHRIPLHTNTHCVAFTLDLDPRERVLADSRPRIYCRAGINTLLQPGHSRCVVLCTTADSTDPRSILVAVRQALDLKHDFVRVARRMNRHPREAVLVGDYLHPNQVARARLDRVYFAGSAVRNSYPIDSAEGAARSALNAVDRIVHDFNLPAAQEMPATVAAESADAVRSTL
jgi:glycine/D-amino acid oxidase-like deaminating enzyme